MCLSGPDPPRKGKRETGADPIIGAGLRRAGWDAPVAAGNACSSVLSLLPISLHHPPETRLDRSGRGEADAQRDEGTLDRHAAVPRVGDAPILEGRGVMSPSKRNGHRGSGWGGDVHRGG